MIYLMTMPFQPTGYGCPYIHSTPSIVAGTNICFTLFHNGEIFKHFGHSNYLCFMFIFPLSKYTIERYGEHIHNSLLKYSQAAR